MKFYNGINLKKLKDLGIILSLTLSLYAVFNFIFVYFSPSIVPLLPSNLVRSLPSCYRSFFHQDFRNFQNNSPIEIVYGDSYSEGFGDEFLNGQFDYGIFKKLHKKNDNFFLVYGRGGFGNKRTVQEENKCQRLFENFTSFSYDEQQVNAVTFVFFEGNDLDNNLSELNKIPTPISDNITFLFPLFEVWGSIKFFDWFRLTKKVKTHYEPYPKTDLGFQLDDYPQSAATELSDNELTISKSVLSLSLATIMKAHPNKKYQFLYIPSVVSSYEFSGNIWVQSFKLKKKPIETSYLFNKQRSLQIRLALKDMVTTSGWKFCDVTPYILRSTALGNAVHGPKDWQHFNAIGYREAANAYEQCF